MPGPLNGNGANINVPAKRINGEIVQPGGSFNFIANVVPITDPPYDTGGIIRNGEIIADGPLGGGMCSASTTLFNAAMRAGLKITERHAHALYISRYPVGLDAAIYGTPTRGENMHFVNNTGHPIHIRGIPGRRKVIFEIWGTDDGRTVHLGDPVIKNKKKAMKLMEYTDDLAPGETKRDKDAYNGFESWVTRTVRDASGNVIEQNTWHSVYRKKDGVTLVGRYPDDPVAGTQVPLNQYVPHASE